MEQAKNGRLIWTGRHFESNPFMITLAIQGAAPLLKIERIRQFCPNLNTVELQSHI